VLVFVDGEGDEQGRAEPAIHAVHIVWKWVVKESRFAASKICGARS
jgi:hypothetical protein